MRARRAILVAWLVVLAAAACGGPSAPNGSVLMSPGPSASAVPLRYVALGDSYTIGTDVAEAERWPNQLVERLRSGPHGLVLVANLAVNGRTSGDLIRDQLPRLGGLAPDFVSLLIGVNDVVQGVAPETYRANAVMILDALLARLPADRIVVVATPDYTVTPGGAAYGDLVRKSAATRAENAVLAGLAAARGIAFVDVYDISLGAASDGAMLASDRLHPSGAQYGLWVDRIEPVVAALIGRAGP